MIDVKTFPVGYLGTNAYVVTEKDTGETLIVDPGCVDSSLTNYLDSIPSEKIKFILLTHGHFDHIGGAGEYAKKYKAKIVISQKDSVFLSDNTLNLSSMFSRPLEPLKADITLNEGDVLSLGGTNFYFMHTPGHTQGSGCFIFPDENIIFSGDTLFYLSMGRTDFPTSNPAQMIESLGRLSDLSGDYTVYPGHDRATTLNTERERNPYLR